MKIEPNIGKNKEIMVTRPSLPPFDEYVGMLRSLWDSAWLTNMGPCHEELREKLAAYLHVPHVELFANGHLALEMVIQAMGLEGEIITTPYSFVSTSHAIVRCGCKPVFCDIREDDCTIDADKIEALVTDKTVAIVPTHVYGHICDVEKIDGIARRHGLKVIYDGAHAFGESRRGVGVGNFGDATMFSFHATKVFHTIEGGAVTFRDEALGPMLYKYKNFGITGKETVELIGGNGKMNEFQAAMGLCNLRHVDGEIARRREIAGIYRKGLAGLGVRMCPENPDVESNAAYFPIFVGTRWEGTSADAGDADDAGCTRDGKCGSGALRDALYDHLGDHGFHCRKYFYPCINDLECYRGYALDSPPTPIAHRAASQVLTLPIYAGLEPSTAEEICDRIREALG
ncbi:MAG: DegT/DnrJ/EryC1/StrS family aminotransferase [Lachnospiraceae bacterium]|nr:DegT/DnrJ/EryC1/StrS family aminotransferase [Lachnospiraceae bacterium]